MQEDVKQYLTKLEKDNVDFLQLQFTDIVGSVKTLTVPKKQV